MSKQIKENEVSQESSSKLLTHLDLLGKAVQFISEIANPTFSAADFDSEDLKTWRKMEQVFCEIEEFINYTTPIMNSWPSVVARFHCLF